MDNTLPVYRLTVDEVDEGVQFVALVDVPAIEKPFMAFSKAKHKFMETGEKRVLTGPIMLADTPIYRNDDRYGEYYVVFDKDTIRKIVQKYFKQGNQHNVNAFHNIELDGVFMFESYITDASRGINPPMGYEGCADGSWFGSFKVENDAVWAARNEFKGFSVEGLFGMRSEQSQLVSEIELITNILKQFTAHNCTKTNQTTFTDMNFKTALADFKTALQQFGSTLKLNFADYKLADGTTVRVDGDLTTGTAVYVITETGTLPAPDGEHVLDGVGTITVQGGIITEVEAPEAAPEAGLPAEAGALPVEAEIAPDAAAVIADKVKEGYPEIDPAVIEQVVQKHLIAIMEELKTAYTQLGWMKEKMGMFSSQVEELKAEVKKIGEQPQAQPQAFSTPHSGIVAGRRNQSTANFDALVDVIKSNTK
jgi:(2Fe-2S) ferredoxin